MSESEDDAPPVEHTHAMTWGQFKAAMDAAGVLNSDEIGYLDVNGYGPDDTLDIERRRFRSGLIRLIVE